MGRSSFSVLTCSSGTNACLTWRRVSVDTLLSRTVEALLGGFCAVHVGLDMPKRHQCVLNLAQSECPCDEKRRHIAEQGGMNVLGLVSVLFVLHHCVLDLTQSEC